MVEKTGASPRAELEALLPPFVPHGPEEHWLFSLHRLGIRPGLDTIRSVLREMGEPQRSVPAIVVGGTNGKGTVAILLARIASAAGLRTGLYTSPHLLQLSERIEIDGERIAETALSSAVRAHRALFERHEATFFESLTALAFEYFAERGVDLAILEVGLGGRLDATNVADKRAVVITSIGLDHQQLLGDTVEAIADEKLALVEAGVPLFLAPMDGPLRVRAEALASERGAPCFDLHDIQPALDSRLHGGMQRLLLSVARRCYDECASRTGWPARVEGAELELPARYEEVGSSPRLVVDTAHNEQALAAVLSQWSSEGRREGSVIVFGAMEDKQLDGVFPRLHDAASDIVLTAARWPRARRPSELHAALRPLGHAELHVVEEVAPALELARELARGNRVLVVGSNFVVAEALDRLGFDQLGVVPDPSLWDLGLSLRRRVPEVTP